MQCCSEPAYRLPGNTPAQVRLRFRSTPALDPGPCMALLQGAECHAGTTGSFVVISYSISVCGTAADAAGVAFQADGV